MLVGFGVGMGLGYSMDEIFAEIAVAEHYGLTFALKEVLVLLGGIL